MREEYLIYILLILTNVFVWWQAYLLSKMNKLNKKMLSDLNSASVTLQGWNEWGDKAMALINKLQKEKESCFQ